MSLKAPNGDPTLNAAKTKGTHFKPTRNLLHMLKKPGEPAGNPLGTHWGTHFKCCKNQRNPLQALLKSAPPPPRFHISRPPAAPQVSHFTPPAAPPAAPHFTFHAPPPPQISHFTPPLPAAPQISHFTPPCGPPGFTFHAPHPRFHISRPAPPPRFHISRCLARLKEVTGSRLQPPDYIGSRGHACSPPTQRPAFPPATLRPIRSNSEPQTASDRRWP